MKKQRELLELSTKEKASLCRKAPGSLGVEISIKRTFTGSGEGSHLVGQGEVLHRTSSTATMLLMSQLSSSPAGHGQYTPTRQSALKAPISFASGNFSNVALSPMCHQWRSERRWQLPCLYCKRMFWGEFFPSPLIQYTRHLLKEKRAERDP